MLLAKENFSDLKEYMLAESLLAQEFPESSSERIKVERDFQASHYIL